MSINKLHAPGEMQARLAELFKNARLERTHSRVKAAMLTGVPESTLKAFERTGQISLRQFLMLCHVYGDLLAVESLYPEKPNLTIDDLVREQSRKKRQRGRS